MKKAFTLAELLIVLGIIGIVAALTMPTLIANYKKKQTVTQLKKSYSIISQAFKMAEAEHGDVNGWGDWTNAQVIMEEYLAPHLNYLKIFPATSADKAMCYQEGGFLKSNPYQYAWFNDIYISSPFTSAVVSILLPDGTCIGLHPAHAYYTKMIFIDVNSSYKKPNVAGEDLFFFLISDDGSIKPYGYDWNIDKLSSASQSNACNRKSHNGGFVCAARIMAEGWEMNY